MHNFFSMQKKINVSAELYFLNSKTNVEKYIYIVIIIIILMFWVFFSKIMLKRILWTFDMS